VSDFPTKQIYGDHHLIDVWPLQTDGCATVTLADANPVTHTLGDDTEMAFIFIPSAADGSTIYVNVTRGSATSKSFPLASGYWPWGTVGEPRAVTFQLSAGTATVIVMEA